MTDQLLTVAEVAERLRISTRTARRMAKAGELPARRITARIWLVARGDLDRWIDERRVPVAGSDEDFRQEGAWQ